VHRQEEASDLRRRRRMKVPSFLTLKVLLKKLPLLLFLKRLTARAVIFFIGELPASIHQLKTLSFQRWLS